MCLARLLRRPPSLSAAHFHRATRVRPYPPPPPLTTQLWVGLSVFLTASAYMSMLQLVHVLSNPYRGNHDNFNADSWLVQQEYSMFYTMRVWACFPRAPEEASPEAERHPASEPPPPPGPVVQYRLDHAEPDPASSQLPAVPSPLSLPELSPDHSTSAQRADWKI